MPRSSRRALPILGIVGLLLLGSFASNALTLPAARSPFPRASGTSLGEEELAQAMLTLGKGAPPTSGRPWDCQSPGPGSAQCGLSSPQVTAATPIWTNLTATAGGPPPKESYASLAYDAADGYVVLFGGIVYGGCCDRDETWTFSGGTWKNVTLTAGTAPSGRSSADMTYDAGDGYVLLFGGINESGGLATPLSDTWKFSKGTWTDITSTVGTPPSARGSSAFAYDYKDHEVILFGGFYESFNGASLSVQTLGDTWTFVGGKWTNITSTLTTMPGSRYGTTFVYDPVDQYLLLQSGIWLVYLGGTSIFSRTYTDTWTFAGGKWTNVTTTVVNSPGAFIETGAAYDAAGGYLVFYGVCKGENAQGDCIGSNSTWTYVGGTFTNVTDSLALSPPDTGTPVMTNDSADGYLLMFGGLGCYGSCDLSNTWTERSNLFAGPYNENFVVSPPGCGPLTFNGLSESNGAHGSFASGSYAVSAPACTGYYFRQWNVSGGLSVASGSASSTTATVHANGTLTAWYAFIPPRYTVDFTVSPAACGSMLFNGTVESTGTGATFPAGTYSAVATACPSYYFQQWNVSGGVSVASSTSASTTATVGAASGTLTAWYLWYVPPPKYSVVFSFVPYSCGPLVFNGSIIPNGNSASFVAGTYSALVDPCEGWAFRQWNVSGGVSVASAAHQTTTATISANGTLTAWYVWNQTVEYLVGFTISPSTCGPLYFNGEGEASGATLYVAPGTYSVLAPSCAGYTFEGWNATGSVVFGDPFYYDTTADVDSYTTISLWYLSSTATCAATAAATPLSGSAPLTVAFSAAVTSCPGTVAYAWTFGDGQTSSTQDPVHTYASAGKYPVELSATGSTGVPGHAFLNITATSTVPLSVSLAPSTTAPVADQAFWVNASTTGGVPPYTYSWPVLAAGCAGSSPAGLTCTIASAGTISLQVETSDALGHTAFAWLNLTVRSSSGGNGGQGGGTILGLPTLDFLLLIVALAAVVVVIAVVAARRKKGGDASQEGWAPANEAGYAPAYGEGYPDPAAQGYPDPYGYPPQGYPPQGYPSEPPSVDWPGPPSG